VCGGVGVVSPCVRTFQGLHSVRLWTPTILIFNFGHFCLKFKKKYKKIQIQILARF
jgi:hypothetical protein